MQNDNVNRTRGPVGLTRIASLKINASDSGDQVVLQWSFTGRVQILHGGPGRGICTCRFSWKRKEQFSFKSRCKNLLLNFESILTLEGPGFSDSGTAGEGEGEGGGEGWSLPFSVTSLSEYQ